MAKEPKDTEARNAKAEVKRLDRLKKQLPRPPEPKPSAMSKAFCSMCGKPLKKCTCRV